ANAYDFAVDVEEAFPKIAEMTFCHQSQISEWLPWVGRHHISAAPSLADWQQVLRQRFNRKNGDLGITSERALEVFTVTAWGAVPRCEQLLKDFPAILPEQSQLSQLEGRLRQWHGGLTS